MKEIHLKAKISRMDVVKNALASLLHAKMFLGWILYIIVTVWLVAYLFPKKGILGYELPRFGWNHMIFLAITLFLMLLSGISWNTIMENSRLRLFDSQIEFRISQMGISQKLSWNGVEKTIRFEWANIQTVSKTGPLITFKLKDGRGFSIFPNFFKSKAHKEETLTLLRQIAKEQGLAINNL